MRTLMFFLLLSVSACKEDKETRMIPADLDQTGIVYKWERAAP